MSFNIIVTVDDSKLQRKISELQSLMPSEAKQILAELENFGYNTYREQVPVSKPTPSRPIVGTLRDSVYTQKTTDGFIVGASAPHGKYPAYGVRPHIIIARTERGMRFWWDKMGTWMRAFIVDHPGQVRNPFHARVYRLIYLKARELVERFARNLEMGGQ